MPVPYEWNLDGKTAIITADRRGWTPILASALAEAGADVVVAGPDISERDESVRAVEKHQRRSLSIDADSTDVKSVNKAVRDVIATFGRIDILVNNAQIEFAKPFPEVTEIEWQQLIDFNVKSMFLWSQSVGKLMIDQNKGRIVNMCSGLASRGLSNSVVYCVTQGAVRQMTSALAIEWAKSNVRVNAIGAGWMSTDLHAVESKKELLVRYIPSKRKGHPTDLCGLLVYLSSDACDFVTGQTIFIDGGAMAHA